METGAIVSSKLHAGFSGLRPASLRPSSSAPFARSRIHAPSPSLKIQNQFHPTPPLVLVPSRIRCKAVGETTTRVTYELADINWDNLGFGLVPTDYMYTMKCPQNGTFSKGELQQFGPVQLNPSSGVLNYGQGLFEGLKAYRKEDGSILLFRPEENALRMRIGAERMCMISPTVEQFVDAVKLTVLANKRWVPPIGKGSLYIRPLLMGSGAVLGLAPAPEYTFLIFVSPVGNYFREGLAPINLIVENDFHRATPGGTGGVKTIGNYASVLKAQSIAKAKGYSDVLYLDAVYKKYLEEVSSCNVFIVKDNTIATPAIKGTILPGITRKSIIDVAQSQGYQVEERPQTVYIPPTPSDPPIHTPSNSHSLPQIPMAAALRSQIHRSLNLHLRILAPARAMSALPNRSAPISSDDLIRMEQHHSAHNYHPIPMVFSHGKGTNIWDPEGNKYLDFLSAYSAVNQGHCHPKVVKALSEQAGRLTLSSRAFYNDKFPVFAEYLTRLFGYEMVLPMNTGAEGVETALKVARKWGYEKKMIPKDEAIIVSCCGCFHGRTLGVISMSCDNDATRGFGPLVPGHLKVDFGDADALEKIFKDHGDKIAGFLFEPIQGEAGVVVPPDGYLKAVRALCSRYNILMIADEIQTGIARTGKMLACDWENVRPDMVILGKALGAGVIPVSAVLADKDVMLCIKPGEHGSTFGGNPLASAVAIAALDVIKDEGMIERAAQLGEEFRDQLKKIQQEFPHIIKEVRGRGLLNAIDLNDESLSPVSAYDICLMLKERGILAKPTHNTIIRLAPPLSISLEELEEASKALRDVLEIDFPNLKQQMPKGEAPKVSTTCDRCGRQTYA